MADDLDHDTTLELNTLLVTLGDLVSDGYSVTGTELRKLLAGCKCFFCNFD